MEGKVPTALWVALAIASVLLILVLVVRKDVIGFLTGTQQPVATEEEATDVVDSVVDSTEPADGSETDDDFASQALAIADSQYQELSNYSQDEFGMLAALMPLNGSQLVQVFQEFGARLYDPPFGSPTYLNLFQFYQEKLDNSHVWGNNLQLDWEGIPDEWIPTDIPSCGGGGYCTEKEAFRAVWWRSGLPLTF